MKKSIKIWLIIAGVLMAVGLIVFTVGLGIAGFDFEKLRTNSMETNTHVIQMSFSGIRLDTSTADITFLPAEDGKAAVVCYEESKLKHTVQVEDDVLMIAETSNRKWYDHIGIHFGTPSVKVYLPEGAYQQLQVVASTGDLTMPENFRFTEASVTMSTGDVLWKADVAETLKLQVSTGRVTAKNIRSETLDVTTTTGKVKLENVVVTGAVNIHVDTGDVTLDRVDGAELYIKSNTGDVTGSLLSDKIFITETSTGKILVPDCVTGGKCKVHTSTGDIRLEVIK